MPNHRIAVVNTEPTLLNLLHELLTDSGYAVTTYLITADTYEQLCQAQPALVLLDVGLGAAAAGWPLLKLLQLDPKTAQIPILITTVDHVVVVEKAALLREQGCDILELPVRFEEVHRRIKMLLDPQ